MKQRLLRNAFLRLVMSLFIALMLIYPLNLTVTQAAQIDPLDMYYPTDIDEHWAYDELDNFANADLLRGYVDAEGNVTLKPNNPVSRAEFVAILVRALGLTSDKAGKSFDDVREGKWYYEPVRIASSLGIAGGLTDTKFGPDRLITRGEIATLIVRAFSSSVNFAGQAKTFSDVPEYYAKAFILKASQAGIVRGITETEFKPYANAKRAEAVVMLQRGLNLQTGNLPADKDLLKVVSDNESQEYSAVTGHNLKELYNVSARFKTGYYLAYNNTATDELIEMAQEGIQIEMEQESAAALKVTEKSDRFAVVESAGGSYKITITQGTNQTSESKPSDGTYMLKKMPDNTWKMYAFFEGASE
ncbi:S-layer homology domain-containing protein [Paenibacillus sp. sptzw28]|uniref:S-layer homology domain-containing protein n=1 Tax=Paenibacillus sp. sptzw28 TaxID=715179 RepID=UPI001C6DDDDF|nr:S-layer homology domain-containing protein [Paenibacillus sp. sptzw28]QYR21983.1 S-layer homology domain-containing protein [Paenibacillus sp. sptzw28]